MSKLLTIFWILCWTFFVGDCFYISNTIGWNVVMTMKVKLLLVLSFFLPILVWCVMNFIRLHKEVFKR
jgi:hypothetical protein